ncbi:MAG TPA: glycosyltransferase family 4 protein [Kineosporiaceae bacterium]|nr:glycosyltransferase family 4 protein [Kineosporiaceae bacterium]
MSAVPEGRLPRVLIVVQNLPVPLDRRVWLECLALRAAGYQVSVICPKGPGDPGYAELDGVHVHKYRPAPQAEGVVGYLWEFVYCWLRTALLSVRVRRRHGFDILQACNPPDTYWFLARLWRPFGVRFVFDHHDLNPELFLSRFGEPSGTGQRAQLAVLRWLERRTFRAAQHMISTNESYRAVAIRRGGLAEADTTVVRSGPDTTVMRPVAGLPELRRGAEHLLVYLGIMGPQDGIDVLLHAMRELVEGRGRRDVHLALLGFGDMLEPMRRLAVDLGLSPYVTFTGRADRQKVAEYLSSARLGLCPDAKTPLNDLSTHNKVMEYMAYALPVVTFDLAETRVSAGDCAVYVPSGDVAAFAEAVDELLKDDDRRVEMSRAARRRCVEVLDWRPQAQAYVSVYDRLAGLGDSRSPEPAWPAVDRRDPVGQVGAPVLFGRPAVDLRDPAGYETFLRTREPPGHP